MAHLLLPLNGVGRGHLIRALIFAGWLRDAGRRPMIALQSQCTYPAPIELPATSVPTLHHAEPEAQRLADDLARVAAMSGPAVIIEDTHPRRVRWPDDAHHVVVVRPTRLEHMRRLDGMPGVAQFLVCDHPDSPTWPYDAAETAELMAWPRWVCLGPVFRTATAEAIADVRARYAVTADQPLIVCSMGGGGELEGSGDRAAFVARVAELADELRGRLSRPRFVFVRGPLFAADLAVPAGFEEVDEEPELPALFAVAHGAIVRPGFNVTWECISAGTPFVALPGTTKSEPVQVRLAAMAARGFDVTPDVGKLVEPAARAAFATACRAVMARFAAAPRTEFLAHTIGPPAMAAPAVHAMPTAGIEPGLRARLSEAVRAFGAPALRIRVDDVTRLDAEVRWLIELGGALGVRMAFEVVPYHHAITGLDALDPDGRIAIGQHGYAHLPAYRSIHERGELIASAADRVTGQLAVGAAILARDFGDRFTRGYSPPYDVPPAGLTTSWRAAGGRFVSWIYHPPDDAALPGVRIGVDPWDWNHRRPLPADELIARLVRTLVRDQGLGLVVHPQCLRDAGPRDQLADVLRCVLDAGAVSTALY